MTVPRPPSLLFLILAASLVLLIISGATGIYLVPSLIASYAAAGPTPEQLQQCRALGIEPQKCSVMEMLKTGHICTGPCLPS
jgi:hypothetical protein